MMHRSNDISNQFVILQVRSKTSTMQAIFESIEAKFGAEVVKNIFKQFDGVDLPKSFVDTYPIPPAVSSDSDDNFTSDDDSISCSQHVKAL